MSANRSEQRAENILTKGTHELIAEMCERLEKGESFNNAGFTEIAERHFGGTRLAGIYTPRDAYDALEVAVNMTLERKACALVGMDANEALTNVLRPFTAQLPRQTDRTHEQNELQQFSTPPALSFLAARVLAPHPTDTMLEPSAGTGSLAVWGRASGAKVICNEINTRRRALLTEALGFEAYSFDGEIIDDLLPDAVRPSAVLMNPPFSATGGRVWHHKSIYGARHVESALRRMQEGGRLVAIVGEGMSLERPAFAEWWQRIAQAYNVRANFHLSGREYGKYGTTFDNQILVIDKTGATPGDNWQGQLANITWGSAETLEEAWTALKVLATEREQKVKSAARGGGASEPEENGETKDNVLMFAPYKAARLSGGVAHPAQIVESASMAAVLPPDVTYRPTLAPEIVTEGRLSDIQLERVIYAGQRHELRLADGERAGFFVGDGTGVGKGRILAGIIADNWNQGRDRALWLSVNNDLLESTRRDLTDLGMRIPLARINDYQAAGDITLPRGVIFSSYSSLISAAKNGARRLDQIQRWLGREGIIIIDEAHKNKNAYDGGQGGGTETGQAVIDLQSAERNPDYRVVYASATGATDVRNMAYMTRLGLWGKGTAFPAGFQEFLSEIDAGGVGAMEMISRDMKALGMYASGSISFGTCERSGKAVEYRERIHKLTPQQREMYDRAAIAWQAVLKDVDSALAVTNGGTRARAVAMNKFWGDHQRFFRQVICAFKVPSVIAETEEALEQGKSVVISLIGTGEARTREQVARAAAAGGALEDLDFSPREVIAAMVERGFPVTLYQDQTDPATGKTIQIPVRDTDGNIVESKQALAMRQALLDGLSALELPENPLDQLVNYFGERNVAELTGRTRRLIRDPNTKAVQYKKRAPEGVAMDRVNVHEMAQFQAGKKRISIISDAASTGISLHASNRAENKQRRVHITLELGWSADKQMQTFGRTHRSDQFIPPEYVLLSTELGGEKRFSSTIARRLGSLGALTKGDRGAADTGDLAKYNFETEEGRAALSLLLRRIKAGENIKGLDNPKQTLRDMGLLVKNREGGEDIKKEDEFNVPRFLNRVLALEADRQNAMFDAYAELFDQTVRYAKATGTYDEGVADIKALSVRLAKQPKVIHTDAITGAQTIHYTLEIDQYSERVSFEAADRSRRNKSGAFFRHQKKGNYILAVPSGHHTDPATGRSFQTFAVYRPEGERTNYTTEGDLNVKYVAVTPEAACEWWTMAHDAIPPIQTLETHIIGGAILPLWQRLKTHRDAKLKVVRVTTDDHQRIVGIHIPQTKVWQVLRSIGITRTLKEPAAIYRGVLDEGEQITLAANLKLQRTALHGEAAIALTGADPYKFAALRELGLINEQVNWKQMFFIPTDEIKGVEVLTRLIADYPVIISAEQEESEREEPELASQHQQESRESNEAALDNVINLESWIITPANEQHSVAERAELTAITDDELLSLIEQTETTTNNNPEGQQEEISSSRFALSTIANNGERSHGRKPEEHGTQEQQTLFGEIEPTVALAPVQKAAIAQQQKPKQISFDFEAVEQRARVVAPHFALAA